ncbi:methyltransferase [Lentzea sp.]|uniref:methyltransferase n=1 Tax=Lentzea sp. TaxID=56099 RepID=UPI002CA6FC7A|nr:methyltransferase [Lentzea sp.]HUQ55220.1 methyltransferase [Lentzea sp.]
MSVCAVLCVGSGNSLNFSSSPPRGNDVVANTDVVTPMPLMRIASGFGMTKALAAAVDLGLFNYLSKVVTATKAQICRDLGLADRPAGMLLTVCIAMELLESDGEWVRNSAMTEEFLVIGKQHYFGDYVKLKDVRAYHSWNRLTDALRTNAPVGWDPTTQATPFEGISPEEAELFYSAMRSLSAHTAATLARAVDLSGARRLLDVGGGSGIYCIELCKVNEQLHTSVYDLPSVCPMIEQAAREAGMADRISAAPGNFLTDEQLPGGHDVALLSTVLHDWDPKFNVVLLRKVYDAIEPGGMVVICEQFISDDRDGPLEGALLSLNMLVETTGGANYTRNEYKSWLTEVGFTDIEHVGFEAAGANGAMLARKPR